MGVSYERGTPVRTATKDKGLRWCTGLVALENCGGRGGGGGVPDFRHRPEFGLVTTTLDTDVKQEWLYICLQGEIVRHAGKIKKI